ncbi:SDR family NAD(P)-dependent oxidoreductase [Nocardioides allogilvus]|uniref:SDR family NAD(P)-dependent oxidoreductase n=1 Tax=Nocardioides allogilvus TaxID=2072017 RepID=UPI000D325369|nr:SDR family NAD(P)-dependent oxidoreductase [Nocardioides allogilvus]
MFDLTGQVALVTGAASGIGAATARVFAEAGADLALAWYPPDGHDIGPVVAAVERAGRRAVVAEVDVTNSADVDGLVERAASELGGMHVVVANAGIARKVQLADLDDTAWNLVLDVDLNGAWRCFRAALPHMQRAGFGRLIATSSVAGTVSAWPEHSHYAAAKAGLVGLVRSLAVEFGPSGVTSNAVAPGVIRTPQALDPVNSLGPAGVDAVAAKIPAGRVGTPEDIAYVYQFLASKEAAYVNGQLLVVDGARHLAGLD